MSEVRKITKWWWAWEPEKIEDWLEDMAAQGWGLFHVGVGAVRFHFVKDKPKRMRYCTDFQQRVDPEYKQIFLDSGWELVYYGSGGWFIWRKQYIGERPDIYTDVDSLVSRNRRLVGLLMALLATQVPLMVLNLDRLRSNGISLLLTLYLLLFALGGYAMFRIGNYSRRLKAKKM